MYALCMADRYPKSCEASLPHIMSYPQENEYICVPIAIYFLLNYCTSSALTVLCAE